MSDMIVYKDTAVKKVDPARQLWIDKIADVIESCDAAEKERVRKLIIGCSGNPGLESLYNSLVKKWGAPKQGIKFAPDQEGN